MASTTLLSQISRSNTYPEIVSVTTEKNKGYISIDTSSWTEQMKSEIPGIKLTVYTEKNLTNIKYTPVSFILDTSKSICITVYDVPAEFDLSIEPLFDKHCIRAHNQLVRNGIEDPPEWVETDTFPISLTFDDVMETPYFPTKTISGVPPLSFKADGTPLISWSMKGNGQQTGTPTPDAPIQPEFVGKRTGNLFDTSTVTLGKYINAQGVEVNSTATTPVQALNHTDYIQIQPNTDYTYHYKFRYGVANTIALCWFDASKNLISRNTKNITSWDSEYTLTGASPANAAFCIINFAGYLPNESMELSFNTGTEPIPYEPYGYKIPLTCAGQTVPVYLGQTQTVRKIRKLVLDGTSNFTSVAVTGGLAFVYNPTLYPPNEWNTAKNIISSHYKSEYSNKNGDIYFTTSRLIIVDFRFETVDAFKTYLQQQYAAGTPVTVWYVLATEQTGIVNESLAKIGDYADELSSTDAGVSIPTAKGQNTLTVDTTIQPSEMSITGNIK